ncbi:hypothetical protein KM1_128040 [Entamoeba histolytica HM-3:IMSS]|uniref:Uncharacterized protein n=2 Tax=Entamoeba histolytica TaxID=5759 RepID=M7W979_ENTHI|nr:hypothetical protein KM1_128040 [Entamoeba histolytica HM-3:IMSS]
MTYQNLSHSFFPLAENINTIVQKIIKDCVNSGFTIINQEDENKLVQMANDMSNKTEDLMNEYDSYEMIKSKLKEKTDSISETIVSLSLLKNPTSIIDALLHLNADCTSIVIIATVSPFLRVLHQKEKATSLIKGFNQGKHSVDEIHEICLTITEVVHLLGCLGDLTIKQQKDIQQTQECTNKIYQNSLREIQRKITQNEDITEVLKPIDKQLFVMMDVVLGIQKEVEDEIQKYVEMRVKFNQEYEKRKVQMGISSEPKKSKNSKPKEKVSESLEEKNREKEQQEYNQTLQLCEKIVKTATNETGEEEQKQEEEIRKIKIIIVGSLALIILGIAMLFVQKNKV